MYVCLIKKSTSTSLFTLKIEWFSYQILVHSNTIQTTKLPIETYINKHKANDIYAFSGGEDAFTEAAFRSERLWRDWDLASESTRGRLLTVSFVAASGSLSLSLSLSLTELPNFCEVAVLSCGGELSPGTAWSVDAGCARVCVRRNNSKNSLTSISP